MEQTVFLKEEIRKLQRDRYTVVCLLFICLFTKSCLLIIYLHVDYLFIIYLFFVLILGQEKLKI